MAKSARSSDRKRNSANLRKNIFGPAHDERTARLSAKLQELASKPKPEQEKAMDVDTGDVIEKDAEAIMQQDADVNMTGQPSSHAKVHKKRSSTRVEKTSRRKPRNQMVFPVNQAKRKRLARDKAKST